MVNYSTNINKRNNHLSPKESLNNNHLSPKESLNCDAQQFH